jgi:hypothetical protein
MQQSQPHAISLNKSLLYQMANVIVPFTKAKTPAVSANLVPQTVLYASVLSSLSASLALLQPIGMALHAIPATLPVKLAQEPPIKTALNAVMELMIMGITPVLILVLLLLSLEPPWTATEFIPVASLVQVPSGIGVQIQAV